MKRSLHFLNRVLALGGVLAWTAGTVPQNRTDAAGPRPQTRESNLLLSPQIVDLMMLTALAILICPLLLLFSFLSATGRAFDRLT
jgi:hypothetical protein